MTSAAAAPAAALLNEISRKPDPRRFGAGGFISPRIADSVARLWLATFAHVLIEALRRLALARSELAEASAQTIRLKLLKIGAVITVSVRRVRFALSETCPHQAEFIAACWALGVAAR